MDMVWRRRRHTESAPCLFFHGIQRGKRVAISVATASEVSTAMCNGVSQLALRLMLSSSWPASMRNVYKRTTVISIDIASLQLQWGYGATHSYLEHSQLCSKVERGVAIVCEVWVL